VTLYITGAGDSVPSVPDGSVYQVPPPLVPPYSLHSSLGMIAYGGPAPGLVAGIWQFNLQLPPAPAPGTNGNPAALVIFGFANSSTGNATASVWITP
jgi:uncharacterized protein (TIGR03437 family)